MYHYKSISEQLPVATCGEWRLQWVSKASTVVVLMNFLLKTWQTAWSGNRPLMSRRGWKAVLRLPSSVGRPPRTLTSCVGHVRVFVDSCDSPFCRIFPFLDFSRCCCCCNGCCCYCRCYRWQAWERHKHYLFRTRHWTLNAFFLPKKLWACAFSSKFISDVTT